MDLQDRSDSRKHAFVGLGFRERGEASAFTAALDEYRQYLRRKHEAEAMAAAYQVGLLPVMYPVQRLPAVLESMLDFSWGV
jgi:hypothetical protein